MNDVNIQELKKKIREFIDSVGEETIKKRISESVDGKYIKFMEEFRKNANELLKTEKKFKDKIKELAKNKPKKGTNTSDKVSYQKELYKQAKEALEGEEIRKIFEAEFSTVQKEVKFALSLNLYEQWFYWALEFGNGSYLATHIAKLTHSSSKGSSVDLRYYQTQENPNNKYLITSDFEYLDCAYPDNKYSSISKVYSINIDGVYVGDLLRNEPHVLLDDLIINTTLLKKACESFSSMIQAQKKQSYFLSKQIYFPIGDNEYHLLLPLTSSSLAQAIHEEHQIYFNKEQTKAREQQRAGKYSATTVVRYPQKAKLNITGSNHSNASSLNGKRGGKITLFSAQPPQWKQSPKSFGSADNEDFFKHLTFALQDDIGELRNYLTLLKNKKLSNSKPERANAIHRKVEAISHTLFDTVILINQNEAENWTISSKLSLPYQLLFEPYRNDKSAKAEKVTKEWQVTISKSFGIFLNKQLNRKSKLNLTPIHSELWAKIFAEHLRTDIATREVSL